MHSLLFQRVITLLLLTLALLGCSSGANRGAGNWFSPRQEDLSKIYVDFVSSNTPTFSMDARKLLTGSLVRQLQEENRLQVDPSVHSLSLRVMALSYQDSLLMVQGELYDDDRFLVYSRVNRRLAPNEDWGQGMELVAAQLLDELMGKMRDLQQQAALATGAQQYIYYGNTYYASPYYSSQYYYDPYYSGWGWWRRSRGNYPRPDYHDGHPNQPPGPKPPRHWVPDGIVESLPRSHVIEQEVVKRRQESESRERFVAPPSTHEHDRFGSGGSSASPDSGFGVNSGPSYSPPSYRPPASHRDEAPRSSAPSIRSESPRQRETPNFSPPSSHHFEAPSAPASATPLPPRHEAPAVNAPSAPASSGGVGRAMPGSHRRKDD